MQIKALRKLQIFDELVDGLFTIDSLLLLAMLAAHDQHIYGR